MQALNQVLSRQKRGQQTNRVSDSMTTVATPWHKEKYLVIVDWKLHSWTLTGRDREVQVMEIHQQ